MLTSASHVDQPQHDTCQYDVANVTIMRSFADSEENRTDEDREYREEYGDDYTEGATSHPIS